MQWTFQDEQMVIAVPESNTAYDVNLWSDGLENVQATVGLCGERLKSPANLPQAKLVVGTDKLGNRAHK